MTVYAETLNQLTSDPKTWLVSGVAGFIGSNLLETLLARHQRVVGLDNFSTGKRRNLTEVLSRLPSEQQDRFHLIEGDLRSQETCQLACQGVDYVLHQAALGSVPFSTARPIASNDSNVTGFLNLLVAARDEKVRRFVYASSSSIYGDDPELPKIEARRGRPLSAYAVTKVVNEMYAFVFFRAYGLESIGLRYFNVFGPRQDPGSAYAAVIPRWVSAMIKNEPATIYGDGSTSRDFCYVANAVQANILAATTANPAAVNQVFNVAVHARRSLNELFELLRQKLQADYPHLRDYQPQYRDFRAGDILHSYADISQGRELLGYEPTHTLEQGLDAALGWYTHHLARPREKAAEPITTPHRSQEIGSVLAGTTP